MGETTPNTGVERGSKTILVVDDEVLIRDVVAATLARAGYRIVKATDGIEGANVFAREFDRIDLLVTDISMPGMLGTDLARFARKIRPDIKVIFASGNILAEEPSPETYIAGAIFLHKPFTSEELVATVAETLKVTACPPIPVETGRSVAKITA
jgi:two-component system cell cycle sensor histidine kinase/response regulator CckA